MQPSSTFPPPIDPAQQITDALHRELRDLFRVDRVQARRRGNIVTFAGRLLYDADASYNEIRHRFHRYGYTPLLRREKGEDVVLAQKGIVEEGGTGNPLLNVLLLVVTLLTTLSAGAVMAGGDDLFAALMGGAPGQALDAMVAGAPFAATLLGILGVHELGHYVAAQLHGVAATLPYFIPMPVGGLGTLGAFIAIRSPMKNRTILFDIGLAGPVAGFVVAVPLLVVGLFLSTPVPRFTPGLTLETVGSSLLVDGIVGALGNIPAGQTLALHPVFFAAWLGLLITGINLLPIGQLDGGHVAYGLLGRNAHYLARGVFILLIVAGFALSPNWFIWAVFVLFGGLHHPPPLNDITDLNGPRKFIGALAVLLFVLVVIPVPFR